MASIERSDIALIKLAQQGDHGACASLLSRYQKRTESIIAHYTDDYALVNDLRQEVFIKIFNNLNGFKQNSSFYTWLYRVTKNTVHNHFRCNSSKLKTIDVDFINLEKSRYHSNGFISDNANPEDVFLSNELLGVINEAYAQLSAELRLCLSMREFDGLSYEEIAKKINCPIGTVRSRIHRARLILNQAIL